MALDTSAKSRQHLKIVVVGHVDHGKSTLIGRLLHDTGSLPEGKLRELKETSERRGMPLEWSFVLDAFQAERDQAITIDTTQIFFKTAQRNYVIIDAPGHREFLKNMISGAALADAAVLVIDAHEGVREQSRRHAYLLHLLGLRQIAVVVNKMDMVGYDEARFCELRRDITQYLKEIGLVPSAVIPISARNGENLAEAARDTMPWYAAGTLLEVLDGFGNFAAPVHRPLRFPVQDVYKFDERRIIAGRVEAGMLRVGDQLHFSPTGRMARVKTIETFPPGPMPLEAKAGQSIGITLDQQIFVERGDVASHGVDMPVLTHVFRATIFWLSNKPLAVGSSYRMKLSTDAAPVFVQSIERVIDTTSLAGSKPDAVQRDEVAEIVLRSRVALALDEYRDNPALGRFVLIDGFDTVGGGVISMEGFPDERHGAQVKGTNLYEVSHLTTADARSRRNGHRGGVVWFTGLSGAGKSTIAMEVERRLFARGMQSYVLDGDNVRKGLNADLGFGPADRVENIRRVGEVAALFADAGFIVITAFISPYRDDRDRARRSAQGGFHEIYIKADVATCESRDPKGLYKRARAGEIPEFTGVSAPYEEPEAPELVIDTSALDVDASVERVLDYIERQLVLVGAAA